MATYREPCHLQMTFSVANNNKKNKQQQKENKKKIFKIIVRGQQKKNTNIAPLKQSSNETVEA